ncbi:hypothetical protein ETAA8_35480 [Anatilimnocola aggregata]|uniref:Uncharacterized protein n=1 Tax=Anatilimnocola aggregata TaxID=2528021 RepID=A0A517YDY3_9BACT|nr:hypothetical protein [Anatilimnocola aggregata]QDU28448.1 hypothetical protein ETAA8_35480 [Anatilimnocola aggregata]
MAIIDKLSFESRSRGGCSNSHYVLCQTTCCDAYCLQDEELSNLYFDPTDPPRKISLLGVDQQAIDCPRCMAKEWDYTIVDQLAEIPKAWGWAAAKG